MNAVAPELTGRVAELREEIAKVERAEPPIDETIAARRVEFEANTTAARALPFRFWQPTYGKSASAGEIERLIEGNAGVLLPAETWALIEATTRARAEARQVLRMPAAEKARTLATLRTSLLIAQAKVEHARRRIEDAAGEMMPRAGEDPAIWLLDDVDLARAVNGLPPTPDRDDTGSERSAAYVRPNDQLAGRI
jgi:hypothetical protein